KGATRRRTAFEIEPEAELGEKTQFEAHDHWRRDNGIVEMRKDFVERLVEAHMRVALRQQPHQRSHVTDAINRMRRRKKAGGPQICSFHSVVAEMLVEPRTPYRIDRIARLQHWLEPRSKSA